MLRTLKAIVLPVLIGLTILTLLGLLGSALFLYREASQVHPWLGVGVAALLGIGLVLLVVYPILRLLRLPTALVRPAKDDGPAWDRFVSRYGRRLLKNPHLREGDFDLGPLREACDRRDTRSIEHEATEAIAVLDERARATIVRHAAAVFTATAVSQSGRLDAALVLSSQLRMIRAVGEIYYQRPGLRELLPLYANVGTAAFVAGEIQESEVLAVLGAPVSAGLTGLLPVSGADPLISLLVNSFLDGSANAFLTLRVGALARRYCGIRLEGDRRTLVRLATAEGAALLAGVVGQGAKRISELTRKLIVESAARGTTRAVQGIAEAGSGLFGRVFDLAEKAGTAAADTTTRGIQLLQSSLRFWESVASEADPPADGA
jgi:hypothetical protein